MAERAVGHLAERRGQASRPGLNRLVSHIYIISPAREGETGPLYTDSAHNATCDLPPSRAALNVHLNQVPGGRTCVKVRLGLQND